MDLTKIIEIILRYLLSPFIVGLFLWWFRYKLERNLIYEKHELNRSLENHKKELEMVYVDSIESIKIGFQMDLEAVKSSLAVTANTNNLVNKKIIERLDTLLKKLNDLSIDKSYIELAKKLYNNEKTPPKYYYPIKNNAKSISQKFKSDCKEITTKIINSSSLGVDKNIKVLSPLKEGIKALEECQLKLDDFKKYIDKYFPKIFLTQKTKQQIKETTLILEKEITNHINNFNKLKEEYTEQHNQHIKSMRNL